MAKEAAKAKDVTPPLKLYSVSGRYATALYSAAAKKGVLQQVEGDLKDILKGRAEVQSLRDFMDTPGNAGAKAAEVGKLMKDMGVGSITQNLMGVMAENGRLPETEKVAADFTKLMMAARGEVSATVTSAEPLQDAELADIKAAMGKFLESGQKLNFTVQVDPTIVGGLVIDIGDKHIDLSINTRIKKMEQLLMQNA